MMIGAEHGEGLPLRPPSGLRFILIALLAPSILAVMLGWLTNEYQHSERIRLAGSQSFDRRLDQVTLLSRLKDAETAQRGFLLTGDAAFLDPYEPARHDVSRQLHRNSTVHDAHVPAKYVPAVRRLVALKFAELDRTIALCRNGDLTSARAIVANGSGRRIMDDLRQLIGNMIAAEARQSADQRAAYVAHLALLQRIAIAVVISLTLMLFGFLLVLWRLRRQRYLSVVNALEAAKRHATILDSTIDAILILNPSGTVETLNAAATRMLGYSADELARRDISVIVDLAPGEGSFHKRVGLVDGRLERAFLPGQRVRHKDGHSVEADVAIGIMSVPSGDHLVVSLRDVAERKRVERIKDDLISTISHELRTPLTSVVGSLGLLRAGVAGAIPAAAERLVAIAENNSRRLIRLINDMLDIDRIESGKLAIARVPIDLRDVVEQACLGNEGLAQAKEITLACATPEQPVVVDGDLDRLVQVVTNLLSNAIRVAPANSAVDVWLTATDERALLAVDDRGAGIPAAFRDRIFGRFERAADNDETTGTGLGLAISREIVARHDGAIWFEDRADGGTRFAFSLPLANATSGGDPTASVLVCEDDDRVATELAGILRTEGCAFDRVRSSEEARAALEGKRYGALLISLTLPGEGGLALAHAVRDGDPSFEGPIVVVAASAVDDGDGPTALDVVDWIEKPGDPARLGEALRNALSRSNARLPVILHLDDDRDLLDVIAAALESEARIVAATDLASARALLQDTSPDVAILDIRLAQGSGLDLMPFLIGADGLAIPTIIYSAQEVPADQAHTVDAVLVKARGSIPDLKATIRRLVRSPDTPA